MDHTSDSASQSRLRISNPNLPKHVCDSRDNISLMDSNLSPDNSGSEIKQVSTSGNDLPTSSSNDNGNNQFNRGQYSTSWDNIRRILHINIFLYAFCFWIQTGVLPYLTKKLGMDMVVFGYLQTFYNFIQLIGGPVYGRFGDLYGGRAALTLAFTMAALMYGLLGIAVTGAFVFLSRVPALFLSANHGTQMVISDLTDESNRAAAIGKLRLSYGLGMVAGPLIGGQVTKYYSEQHAALVACCGSLLSVLLIQLFIPSQTKEVTPVKEEKTKSSIFSLEKYISLVTQTPGALFFLGVTMISALPNAILQSMFPMILMERFELSAEYNGYMLSALAVVGMLIQGFCMGPLTKQFSDMILLRASVVLVIMAFVFMVFVQDVLQLALVMIPLTIGNSVIGIILQTVMTKIVTSTDSGTMIGIGYAGSSFVHTFAPTLGGALLAKCGFFSFGAVGIIVNVILLVVLCVGKP